MLQPSVGIIQTTIKDIIKRHHSSLSPLAKIPYATFAQEIEKGSFIDFPTPTGPCFFRRHQSTTPPTTHHLHLPLPLLGSEYSIVNRPDYYHSHDHRLIPSNKSTRTLPSVFVSPIYPSLRHLIVYPSFTTPLHRIHSPSSTKPKLHFILHCIRQPAFSIQHPAAITNQFRWYPTISTPLLQRLSDVRKLRRVSIGLLLNNTSSRIFLNILCLNFLLPNSPDNIKPPFLSGSTIPTKV